jgi:putative membrane protein
MWGYGPNWGMMGPWGGGWGGYGGWGPIGMIIWIIVLALVIAGIVWFVRAMTQRAESPHLSARRPPGLEVLEERYARGEINRDEYLQKKRDILG